MGSDTCGSIRIPAALNNLVGLRPTKGLSSIAGIVPLSVTQDVGGPLARTVADLAAVLDATVGEDADDPATHLPAGQVRPKFSESMRSGSLQGVRIGVLEPLFGDASDDREVVQVIRAAIEEMKKAGAEPVPVAMPDLQAMLDGSSVINSEFQEDLASYLAKNPGAPVHSLGDIVKGGLIHTGLETVLTTRLSSKGRASSEYELALAKRTAVRLAIAKIMEDQKLDALVYPTLRRKPARIGEAQGGATCQLSASTGYPAISVPAGFTADGLPVGMELMGRAFEDGKLVGYAYAYEQATHHRKAPLRTPALGKQASVPVVSWEVSEKGVTGRFRFDPATSELTYSVKLAEEGLAATIHRAGKEGNGPVIAVLANHPFRSAEGTVMLSNPDREKLVGGGLYLRVSGKAGVLRVAVRAS